MLVVVHPSPNSHSVYHPVCFIHQLDCHMSIFISLQEVCQAKRSSSNYLLISPQWMKLFLMVFQVTSSQPSSRSCRCLRVKDCIDWNFPLNKCECVHYYLLSYLLRHSPHVWFPIKQLIHLCFVVYCIFHRLLLNFREITMLLWLAIISSLLPSVPIAFAQIRSHFLVWHHLQYISHSWKLQTGTGNHLEE